MKREHVDKLIENATHHTCYDFNYIESSKLIRRLLSVVCYQQAKIDVIEEKRIPPHRLHTGPR